LIVAAQRALNSLKAQLRFALLVFKVRFAFAVHHFSSYAPTLVYVQYSALLLFDVLLIFNVQLITS
jgi:hypothetical protein